MALPRLMRFASRREVTRLLRRPALRVHTPLGRTVLGPPRDPVRLLFVVSRAVSKRATERNRIRRHLTAWASNRNLAAMLGRDTIVFVAAERSGATRRELVEAAESSLDLLRRQLARPRY